MKWICSILILIGAPAAAQTDSGCGQMLLSHFAIATTDLEAQVRLLKALGFKMIDKEFTTTWDKNPPWDELVDGLYGKDSYGRTKRVRYARMLWPEEGLEFWKLADLMIAQGTIPSDFRALFQQFPDFSRTLLGQASTLTKTLREMGVSLTGGQLGIEVFEIADSTGRIERVEPPLLHYAFSVDGSNNVQNVAIRLNAKGWETVFPKNVTTNTEVVFMKMLEHQSGFGNGRATVEIRKYGWVQPSSQDPGK